MKWKILGLIAASAFLAACGGADENVQNGSSAEGSVVGVVTSAETGQPLSGVQVSVYKASGNSAALVTGKTNNSGAYVLSGLPIGDTYQLHFKLDGYLTGLYSAKVPSNYGDYPAGNAECSLNTMLYRGAAAVTGRVFAVDAAPAVGAQVTVDLRPYGVDLVTTTTVDASGMYSISGLPASPTGFLMNVRVEPYDMDGDGVAEYNTYPQQALGFPGITTRLDFDLRNYALAFMLIDSDVEGGTHGLDTPLHFTFNDQLDLTKTQVTLRDMTVGGATVGVVTSLDTAGTTLVVATSDGTVLADGHNYSVSISATAQNGISNSLYRSFLAEASAGTLLPAVTGLSVRPQSPATTVDYKTTSLCLSWNATAGASRYRIFARDTRNNPTYVQVATPGSMSSPYYCANLPLTFDAYSGDYVQTPFAYGTKVDFAVVAENIYGEYPDPGTATPVTVWDTTPPTISASSQSGSANNTGASPVTVNVTVSFSEYMDKTVVPSLSGLATGVTSSFAWSPDTSSYSQGVVTLTIPAGTDGRNLTVSGGKDTSGNTMASAPLTLPY